MKFKPHPYQEVAIQHIINHPASGLLLDMGMGKTVSTLTAVFDLMYDYFDVSRVLVIAPKRVAEDTWSREAEKWNHTRGMTVSKVLGSQKQRIRALMAEADLYVTNRENVEWLVDYYKKEWPFDMVVIDELSSFKSSKARRFRALKKVRPMIKRLVGLTGTPAPNSLLDLWPQMYLLDGGERLGRTLTAYRDRYFQAGARNGHIVYEWRLKDGSEETIHNRISDICISMQAKDYLKLPERIDHTVYVEMDKKTKEKYKQLEKDLLLPFSDSDVVADTAAVLSNKLLQLANGAVYDEHGDVQEIHDEKLRALEEIQEAANGNSLLVFYTYKHDLERIQDRFRGARTLESSKDIKDWNDGKVPMLLAHPASAGHGLNLQDGGHTIVWYGLTWSLELYQQANARLDRQGQTKPVVVHHLVAKDTVDEDVMKALENKAVGQNALLQAVKARLEAVGHGS
ncbi:DEAD/DEAH box helicase [Halalkalibacterium halodurans]|uniref:DEAD/DEAH box helicase n=1 Tax=Halalkalibacterium halodurans TaxID=86665 RepID=UPI002E22BF7F|nr:DEAD/DEAH box helicase [Halalkalibacterium halodurans]MED4082035.1 DEAD/DEAH box helicase [Halalkalibacterium halodurans]MED4086620.1 DEAD/DEAH box helicase [Halalkalibacterium halodurans]MED4104518.1 DEAD/DEAH box helicase [Halalkalibacterium halodurans]MED4110122.1 DEAD/DEAH box helicase [Halalkalibacterium halodurans]